LLIIGNNGRGKTMIAKNILPVFFDYALGKIVRCYHATEINDNADFILTRRIVILDDIGTEDQMISYGERRWIFPEIVDRAEQKENILIITTNLDPDEIQSKYGLRTRDRLRAICNPVLFKGESMRK
jgi:DNA replication protein DnaC